MEEKGLRRILLGLTVAILTAGFIAPPAMATHTWDAEGASKLWAEIVPRAWANWDPENDPGGQAVVFNRVGAGGGPTNILDRDYNILSLTVEDMDLGQQHWTNVDNYWLSSGAVKIGYVDDNGHLVVTDGEYQGLFRVGQEFDREPMYVGVDDDGVIMREGALHVHGITYVAYLGTLNVGVGKNVTGSADFTDLEDHEGVSRVSVGTQLLVGVQDYAGVTGGATGSLTQDSGRFTADVGELYVGSYRAGENNNDLPCVGTMALIDLEKEDITLNAEDFYVGSKSNAMDTQGTVTVSTKLGWALDSTVQEDMLIGADVGAADDSQNVNTLSHSVDFSGVAGPIRLTVEKSLRIGTGKEATATLDMGNERDGNFVQVGSGAGTGDLHVGVRDMEGNEVFATGTLHQWRGSFMARVDDLYVGVATDGTPGPNNGGHGELSLSSMMGVNLYVSDDFWIGVSQKALEGLFTSRSRGRVSISDIDDWGCYANIAGDLLVAAGSSGTNNESKDESVDSLGIGTSLTGELNLGSVSGTVTLEVSGSVKVAVGADAYGSVWLPADSAVSIGVGGLEVINIGCRDFFHEYGMPVVGAFTQEGGTFRAYVNQVVVGYSAAGPNTASVVSHNCDSLYPANRVYYSRRWKTYASSLSDCVDGG